MSKRFRMGGLQSARGRLRLHRSAACEESEVSGIGGNFAFFATRNAEALKQWQRRGCRANFFSDYREALQTFKPDFSLICTPAGCITWKRLRAALAGRVSRVHRKNLFRTSRPECRVLIAEARHHDRNGASRLQTCVFHPGLQILKELIDSGKIGARALAECRGWTISPGLASLAKLSRELQCAPGVGWRHYSRWLTTKLDYICWLMGWPTEVSCRAEASFKSGVGTLRTRRGFYPYFSPDPGGGRGASRGLVQRSYTPPPARLLARRERPLWGLQFAGSALVFQRTIFQPVIPGWKSIPYKFEINDMLCDRDAALP